MLLVFAKSVVALSALSSLFINVTAYPSSTPGIPGIPGKNVDASDNGLWIGSVSQRRTHAKRDDRPMTIDEIDDYLGQVSARLTRSTKIYAMGGLCGVKLGSRTTTKDVDYIVGRGSSSSSTQKIVNDLAAAVSRVARDNNLDPEWMNTRAAGFASRYYSDIINNSNQVLWRSGKLTVYYARFDFQLARKLGRIANFVMILKEFASPTVQAALTTNVQDAAYFLYQVNGNGGPMNKATLERIARFADQSADVLIADSVAVVNTQYRAITGSDGFASDVLGWG